MIFLGVLNLILLIVVHAGVLGMRDAQRMTDRQLRALLARVPRRAPTESEIKYEAQCDEGYVPDYCIGKTIDGDLASANDACLQRAVNQLCRERAEIRLRGKQEV